MQREVSLSIWQRLYLTAALSQGRGSVGAIRKAFKILDIIEITPAEKEKLGWEQRGDRIKWDEKLAADMHQDFTFDGNLYVFLQAELRKIDEAEGFPRDAAAEVVDLADQFNLGAEEENPETN